MKKLISFVMVMCFAMPNLVSAQDVANDYKFYVGGAIGFTQNFYDGNTTTSNLTLMPELGYNINDKLSVGLDLGYTRDTDKYDKGDGSVDLHKTMFIVRPYVRYAFYRNERVNIFCDGGLSYVHTNKEQYGGSGKYDSKSNGFEVGLYPGISYRISSRFSLVAHLGSLAYASAKPDYDGAKSTSTFGLSLANGTSFGLYLHF